jgi:8-oxo-dGTP diphosphatase
MSHSKRQRDVKRSSAVIFGTNTNDNVKFELSSEDEFPNSTAIAPTAKETEASHDSSRVAIGIVVRRSQILMIRRDIPNLDVSWVFPGGKIESDESALEAAKREVFEETGVYCEPVKIVHTRTHPVSSKLMVYVVCEYQTAARQKTKEFQTRWFGANQLPALLGSTLSRQIRGTIHAVKMSKGAPSKIRSKPRNAPTLPGFSGVAQV